MRNYYYSKIFLVLFFFTNISFLQAQKKGIIKGKVIDKFGSLPGANVLVKETGSQVQSALEGEFFLEHVVGDYTLKIDYLLYKTREEKITVKEGDTIQVNIFMEPGFAVDQVSSLGTKGEAQTSLEQVLPVDIISQQQIKSTSYVELGELLHYLLPSFNSNQQTIADGTDHIDPATIHGLGPDQLLVLINGKRRHTSSLVNVNGTVGRGAVGTDFNAIPLASVDHIEILKSAATSHYGSDAIAGVVNVVLKDQTGIIELQGRSSITEQGDGFTTYISGNVGLDLSKKGFFNVTTEFRNREEINRAGRYTGQIFDEGEDTPENLRQFYESTGLEQGRVMRIGVAATRNIALQFNSEFNIGKDATIYAFGGRNYREGNAAGFYRFPHQNDRVVKEIHPLGFLPEITMDIQDDGLNVGFRGKKLDWNIDFSHTIGINTIDLSVQNSNNASLGINSKKTFNVGGFAYQQNVTNLDFSKKYDFLKGLNLAFGAQLRVENYQIIAGEEASYKDGNVIPKGGRVDGEGNIFDSEDAIVGLQRAVGAQVFPGFRPENERNDFRTNGSGYLDIETNATDALLIALSIRFENYNDFDSQNTYRSALRYKLNNDFSLRASISTGFRAPSLHQLFFNNVGTQFDNGGNPIQVGTFNNFNQVAEALDIGRLKPELSLHTNLGFTAKLFNKFSVYADYYYTKIDDRIVLSNAIERSVIRELERDNFEKAQFFTNAIDTETLGVDFRLDFNNNLAKGKLNSYLAINWSKTSVIENRALGMVGDAKNEVVIFDRGEVGRIEYSQPRFKTNFMNIYEFDKFIFTLNNTFFGSVRYVHSDATPVLNTFTGNLENQDQTFKPKVITDFQTTYRVNDFIRVSIGANNLFNIYPDKQKHSANTSNGNFVYNRRVQQFGVRGASYFGKILLNL